MASVLTSGSFLWYNQEINLLKMRLRKKILIAFLLPASLIAIMAGFLFFQLISDRLTEEIYDHLETAVHLRADHIASVIGQEIQFNQLLTAGAVFNENFDGKQKEVISEFFDRLVHGQSVHKMWLADADGVVVASSDRSFIGTELGGHDIFELGKMSTYYEGLKLVNNNDGPAFVVASPIMRKDGLHGVVSIEFKPSVLYAILSDRHNWKSTGETYLVDSDFMMISPSRFVEDTFGKQEVKTLNSQSCFDSNYESDVQYLNRGEVNLRFFESSIRNFDDYRGVSVLGTHIYFPELGWCLLGEIDTQEALTNPLRSLLYFSILIIAVVILLAMISAVWFSRYLTKNIEDVEKGIKEIEKGNLDYKINLQSDDEIGQLSKTFDSMADQIKEARSALEGKVEERTKALVQEKEVSETQKRRLNISLEAANIGTWDWDIKSNKLTWDDRMFSIFEIKRGQFTSDYEAYNSCLHPDDAKAANEAVAAAIKGEKEFDTKFRIITPGGGTKTIRGLAKVSFDENGKASHMTGVNWDMSKEEAVDRAKTEFVSLASHQLRSPLVAVQWCLETLMKDGASLGKDELCENLEAIYKGNKRMLELIESLLNVSRLEFGTLEPEREIIDIRKISDDTIDELDMQMKKKCIKFSKDYGTDIPEKVFLDRKLTRMVLQNLLSNAIKYTPDKGEVKLQISCKDGLLLCSITDTGYGIPEADKDRVFSKLFRSDNIRDKVEEGTGLGLYLVKSIIDNLGGKVWFESTKDKGTTFTFTLPIEEKKEAEVTKSSTSL
ncbi:PAS domain-containing protein [Candidatus Gracilibacteria bacterium]|nr:PAS domain-containing protein [Candidatus Gracilibacteria bacterium]